jgi:cell division protein FtsQ
MGPAEAAATAPGEGQGMRAALAAAATLAALALGALGLDYLLRPDTFPVRSVSFEGDFRHVSRDLLAEAVAEAASGNFYALDLEVVRRAAESVPWVHRAAVRRRWPDGLQIAIREQQLAARWRDSAWVNADGELAELSGQDTPAGLPRLEGPDGSQGEVLAHYRRLSEILAPLGLEIARLELTPRHSWRITLANGLSLIAGRDEPQERLARLARHYPALAAQAGRIRQVDLRYTHGFAIEWRASAAGAP